MDLNLCMYICQVSHHNNPNQLAHLKLNGHRVLIFSQMVRMLDILSDYMSLRGYAHQRLDGMIALEARKRSNPKILCSCSRLVQEDSGSI